MIDPIYLGLAGAIILILAWLFETIECVRKHKSLIDLRFAFASLFATGLLSAYSWQIKNDVFLWLNIILLIFVVLEIAYTLSIKKVHKRFKR